MFCVGELDNFVGKQPVSRREKQALCRENTEGMQNQRPGSLLKRDKNVGGRAKSGTGVSLKARKM